MPCARSFRASPSTDLWSPSTSPCHPSLFVGLSRGSKCVRFPQTALTTVNGCVSGSACRNTRSSPNCLLKSSSILTAYMSCLPLPCSATARLQLETRSIADMHVLNGAFGPDLVKEWSSWIFATVLRMHRSSLFVFCRAWRRYLFLPRNSCTSLREESA